MRVKVSLHNCIITFVRVEVAFGDNIFPPKGRYRLCGNCDWPEADRALSAESEGKLPPDCIL
jgi:hypothetical protein